MEEHIHSHLIGHLREHAHGHGHHGPRHGDRHDFRQWGGHAGHHKRGRRGSGPDQWWREFFGGDRGPGWGSPFGGPRGMGGHRERLERGLLRHVILSVLKDGPRHGYEIIKHVEERTQGRYSPSPGTLYPTLQYLEDLGLVRSEQDADKRVYHLTESGKAELDKQQNMVDGFWSRFTDRTPSGASMHEMRFAGDAFKDLLRTIGGALHSGALSDDPETVRKIRQALERCQTEIREIVAQSAAKMGSNKSEEPRGEGGPDLGEEYV